MGVPAYARRIGQKTSDIRFDPHKKIIADRARLVLGLPSSSQQASSMPTITTFGRGLQPPSESRRLRRSASVYNFFNRNVETIHEEAPDATAVNPTSSPRNSGENEDDDIHVEQQPGEIAEDWPTEEHDGTATEPEARDELMNFPIDRYPSPVDDEEDEEDPAAEAVLESAEAPTDGPLTFTFPPSEPFSASDPEAALKMLDVVKKQRTEVLRQLDTTRNELGLAMLDANIVQAELDEECAHMQALVDGLTKVVGKRLIKDIIKDADYFVKNGFDWDEWEALCADVGYSDEEVEIEVDEGGHGISE